MKQSHPAAWIFPLLEGPALDDLVADIRTNGLREPIVLDAQDLTVLDGRSRERACELAGVDPVYTIWDGRGTPVEFVVTKNLQRQNLTMTQRAIAGARLFMFRNDPATADKPCSLLEAGTAVGASAASVGRARVVLLSGDHDLIGRLIHGDVRVNTAFELVKGAQLLPLPESKPALANLKGIDNTRAGVAKRRHQMRKMAAAGLTSEQIAGRIGITVDGCRMAMKKAGIDRKADRSIGQFRKIDYTRMVDVIVSRAEEQFDNAGEIQWSQVDPAQLHDWIARINRGRRAIDKFHRTLIEKEKQYGSQKANGNGAGPGRTPVQVLRREDQFDEDPSGARDTAAVQPGVGEQAARGF